MNNAIVKQLKNCKCEKDVENCWRSFLSKQYGGCVIESPANTDGLLIKDLLRMICEFKYDENYANPVSVSRSVGQVLYYLKALSSSGTHDDPNVIFIADKNKCFAMSAQAFSDVKNDNTIDWNKTVASGCGSNKQLMRILLNHKDIEPVVFDIDENFNWESVAQFIERLVNQSIADVSITPYNIYRVYNHWATTVVKEQLSPERGVQVFFDVLLNPEHVYQHPKQKGMLVTPDGNIKISPPSYVSFFKLYKESHSAKEKADLLACADRVMQDDKRRRTGAFFTPAIWVDESYKTIENTLGKNWREEYIVWDCSCGTGNLTRDYSFNELYLSTLEKNDVDMLREAGFNSEATIFQFDFLNDGAEKLPVKLREALKNGKVLFLINPPYGTAGNLKVIGKTGSAKAGMSTTKVQERMKADKIRCSEQLFAQFVYNMHKLTKGNKQCYYALFTPYKLYSGQSTEPLRKHCGLDLVDGFSFSAGEFDGTDAGWPVLFSISKMED